MKNIKNISIIILVLITLIFGYLLFKKKDPEIITKRVVIEVPVPGKLGTFEPVKFPTPKIEKPRPKLEKEFSKADSIKKDSLYRDAITERFYEEIFDDSTQTITVKSNVQGKLLEQSVDYFIKPYTIPVDTTLNLEIEKRNKIFVGGEVMIPAGQYDNKPALKGNLMWQLKNDNIFSISYDTNGNLYAGYNIKL